jgi:hypothetical protein
MLFKNKSRKFTGESLAFFLIILCVLPSPACALLLSVSPIVCAPLLSMPHTLCVFYCLVCADCVYVLTLLGSSGGFL